MLNTQKPSNQLCANTTNNFKETGPGGGGVLPVKFGSLHQGVGVPVLDHHLAAQTHEALGVILVLSGHLEPQTKQTLKRVPSWTPERGTDVPTEAGGRAADVWLLRASLLADECVLANSSHRVTDLTPAFLSHCLEFRDDVTPGSKALVPADVLASSPLKASSRSAACALFH